MNRASAGVTTRFEFARRIDEQRPAVLRGGARSWPAATLWSFEFFEEVCGSDEVSLTRFGPGGERNEARSSLREYLHAIRRRTFGDSERPPYLCDWHACFANHPELLDHVRPSEHFSNRLDRIPPTRRALHPYLSRGWVLIGPARTVYPFHQDILGMQAWLVQLRGTKRVRLRPPESPPVGASSASATDTGELELTLRAGDLAFIPSRWWHEVTALEPSISMNGNFVDEHCLDAFVDEVRAQIEHLPEALKPIASQVIELVRGGVD